MRPGLEKSRDRAGLENSIGARIRADSHQIKQVLINLVHNAAESISQFGTVTLRARRDAHFLDPDKCQPASSSRSKTPALGIPLEVEKRLFDPFFTTKESGTGLGLAIAAR